MGAPTFTIYNAVPASSRQYFQWESGELPNWQVTGNTTLTQYNDTFVYMGASGDNKWYQGTTNATSVMQINSNEMYGEYYVYFDENDGSDPTGTSITGSYDKMIVFGSSDLQSNNCYYVDGGDYGCPAFTEISNGTGEFSWQLDSNGWSTDSTDNFVELTGLTDTQSGTLYVREKLQDTSYGTTASFAFTVAFDNGAMVIVPDLSSVTTDLTSYTVNFSFPDYDSKMLSGLTTDTFGLMGIWVFNEMKNGQPSYTKDSKYLWYCTSLNRWVMTQLNYYNGTYSMDDYYYSYMYQNSTGTTLNSTGWSAGMEADMGQIQGTITWASDDYAIIPIGTNSARYRVDAGSWIDLSTDDTDFVVNMTLGNTYSIDIQELLENGLYTDSATVSIECALAAAPTVDTPDGTYVSADGYNVVVQWQSAFDIDFEDNYFDGRTFDTCRFFPVDVLKSPNQGFIDAANDTVYYMAVKLSEGVTYRIKSSGDGYSGHSIYKPDGSAYALDAGPSQNYHDVTPGPGEGGLWRYAITKSDWNNYWYVQFESHYPDRITQADKELVYASGTGKGMYRYRLNGSGWSETLDSKVVSMNQLVTGDNTVDVQRKSSNGIWSDTGTMTLTVTNGASSEGGTGGVTIPDGKYAMVFSPATGKEYLWDGSGDLAPYELITN